MWKTRIYHRTKQRTNTIHFSLFAIGRLANAEEGIVNIANRIFRKWYDTRGSAARPFHLCGRICQWLRSVRAAAKNEQKMRIFVAAHHRGNIIESSAAAKINRSLKSLLFPLLCARSRSPLITSFLLAPLHCRSWLPNRSSSSHSSSTQGASD